MKHSVALQTDSNQVTDHSVLKESKEQFWKVGIAELKLMYSKGLLTVQGYVYGIIKTLRSDDWWLKLDIKKFCEEYDISKTSLYRAISKLASDKDLNFEWSAKEVRVRFVSKQDTSSSTIPTNEKVDKTTESIEKPLSHSQQDEKFPDVGINSQMWENSPKFGNQFPDVGKSAPEKSTQQGFQASYISYTDIEQIQSIKRPDEIKISQDQEVVQDSNNHVEHKEDLARNRKPILEAKNCVPCENDSQRLSFNDNPIEEPDFLSYYKTYRKAQGADIKNASAYVAMCLKNEDEGAIEVNNLFKEWQAECRTTKRKINNYADSPAQVQKAKERFDFESWEHYKHEGQLSTLQSLGIKKFIENVVSAAWYKWASAKYPHKFAAIPA